MQWRSPVTSWFYHVVHISDRGFPTSNIQQLIFFFVTWTTGGSFLLNKSTHCVTCKGDRFLVPRSLSFCFVKFHVTSTIKQKMKINVKTKMSNALTLQRTYIIGIFFLILRFLWYFFILYIFILFLFLWPFPTTYLLTASDILMIKILHF